MKTISTIAVILSASPAFADFLKPNYYRDQCAELAFETAYEHRAFVLDEFEHYSPSIVDYEDSRAVIEVSILLEEDRLFLNKKREFVCGFDKDGLIVDYIDPFDEGALYEFDEPFVYSIVGEYVDVQDEGCTLLSFSSDVAKELASGAAIGAALGISGGIIAIPVSGGVLIAAGSGGGAIVGGAVGGLVGTARTAYHCVSR